MSTQDEFLDIVGGFADLTDVFVNGLESDILTPVDRELLGLEANVQELEITFDDYLGANLDPLNNYADFLDSQIVEPLDVTTQEIEDESSLLDKTIDFYLSATRNELDFIQDAVHQGATAVIDGATQATQAVVDAADEKINEYIDNPLKVLTDLDDLVDPLSAFSRGAEAAGHIPGVDALGGLTDIALGGLGDKIESGLSGLLGGFFGELSGDYVERIEGVVKLIEDDPDTPDIIKQLTAPGLLPVGAVGGVLATFALPLILGEIANTALAPYMRKIGQNVDAQARSSLLDLGTLTRLHHAGLTDYNQVQEDGGRQGFKESDIRAFGEMMQLRPTTVEQVDYWRRGILTEEQFDTELTRLGWTPTWLRRIKEAAFPPPPVQDLILMAVREVFDPEITARFGQFDDLPSEFVLWGGRIGLSEEWASRYWAAHWALPSLTQGYEMFHRLTDTPTDPDADSIPLPSGAVTHNVIGESTLQLLMRAQDVMPFWRQGLQAIQFRTLTRVDVRRMEALGVLDSDGVFKAYLELGYKPSDAQRMLEFTLAFNSKGKKEVTQRERDLTKGDIIGLFNDGLLVQSDAVDLLQAIGYDENESQLLVNREIVQELRAERKAEIANVVHLASTRTIDFETAQDRLDALDPTDLEKQRAINRILRAREDRSRKPSIKDLTDWFKQGFLGNDDLINELRGLGIPDLHILARITNLEVGRTQGERNLMRSALRGSGYTERDVQRMDGVLARFKPPGGITASIEEI